MFVILHTNLFRKLYFSMPFRRSKSVLVIAEHNNEILTTITQCAITAARKIGGELTVLVAGRECSTTAKSVSTIKGLKRVLVAENMAFNGFLAENFTPLILAAQKQFAFTHIIAGATFFGKTILPRVAAKLNVPAVTDVTSIKDSDTFVRPIYAGNAFMTLKIKDPIKVITIKQTNFVPCILLQETRKLHLKLAAVMRATNLNKALTYKDNKYQMEKYLRLKKAAENLENWKPFRVPIEQAPAGKYNLDLTRIVKQDFIKSNRSKLNDATIVICGGKGMKSANNFEMLYDLAQKLNAAVGASKAAVDAGFASSDIQIGENGKIVAPNLYIAVGVSGNDQHVAGIKNSTIVAINKNPHAPIFKIANYGLVADLFQVIPRLNVKLNLVY